MTDGVEATAILICVGIAAIYGRAAVVRWRSLRRLRGPIEPYLGETIPDANDS